METGTIIRRCAALAALITALLATASPAGAEQTHHAPKVQVTVVDDTHGHWPGLATAVAGWNRSPIVHLQLADTCAHGTYCVHVGARYASDEGWIGLTGYVNPHRAQVDANMRYHVDTNMRAAVLCHELGHALGLAHPTEHDKHAHPERVGCIAGTTSDPTPVPTATDADLQALALVARTGHGHQGWGALYWAGRVR